MEEGKIHVNKKEITKKLYNKLPDLLTKLLKTVIVHIVMLIYHISMPPWVMVMKVKKALKSHKNTNEKYIDEETETNRKMSHRRMWRLSQRRRQL